MKDDTAILKRLSDLEARVAAIDGKVVIEPAPMLQAPIEEGARVFHTNKFAGEFVVPTEDELRKLLAIVIRAYPKSGPDLSNPRYASQNEARFFTGFVSAFLRIGHMGRAEKPDTKRYASFWVEEAEDWLRVQGIHNGDIGAGFFPALIAHGDVDFILANPLRGVVAAFALSVHSGRPATDKWRHVLSSGKPTRMPIEVKGLYGEPSPSTVRLIA